MGVPKAFGNIVRVIFVIHMLVVTAMICTPNESRILHSCSSTDQSE